MLPYLSPGLLIALVVVILAVIVVIKGLVIIQESEVMVIERLGAYHRTLQKGVNFIIPFLDQPRPIKLVRYLRHDQEFTPVMSQETRIDLRESVMDFPSQPVVTTDNVTVRIDGAIYFQIIDPANAVYKIENMSQAVEVLAKTTLRSVVGQMELDRIFESRAEVNAKIKEQMEEPASKWGVAINRIEVQDIEMPEEVKEAMHLQMSAERRRRATVTEAEGDKAAAIAKAQGQRESAILNAQGDKEAAILRAQGESRSIELVLHAMGEGEKSTRAVIGYLLGQSYIAMLPEMAKDGERVFVPYESSALLGAMGAFRDLTADDATMADITRRAAAAGGLTGSASAA
ncbi:SPFH domain-containing protein [Halomonas cerina]|uniref:Regulator of protease activity HflC (Stomatin/prohibitin superfamily) n=1 Tax=Halomonas cerina TaxID=447424 RepID=A0A839VBR9_9GAMM|nr:SPFH domain-containing protein [Halomonas cerina]MBB3191455.1 regulator of protease activity HflC (stomatin/prohibitin superfamily) [Halomonas cerina]